MPSLRCDTKALARVALEGDHCAHMQQWAVPIHTRSELRTCTVCSSTPPLTKSIVAGSKPICPEMYSTPPAEMAWLYGPSALGAFFVSITRFWTA